MHIMVVDAPADPEHPDSNPLLSIPTSETGFRGRTPKKPVVGSVWVVMVLDPYGITARSIILTYPVTEIFRHDHTGGEFRTFLPLLPLDAH